MDQTLGFFRAEDRSLKMEASSILDYLGTDSSPVPNQANITAIANSDLPSTTPMKSRIRVDHAPLSNVPKSNQFPTGNPFLDQMSQSNQNVLEETAMAIRQRDKDLTDLSNKIKEYQKIRQPKEGILANLNLQPLLAMVDPNFAKYYTPPTTKEEIEKENLQFSKIIMDEKNKLTDDKLALAKTAAGSFQDQAELYAKMFGEKPKNLHAVPTTQIDNIVAYSAIGPQIDELKTLIENNKDKLGRFGGSITKAKAYFGTDPLSQTIVSKIANIRQTIGKPMEGGVLRPDDEKKYQNIVGSIEKNPDFFIANLGDFKRLADEKIKKTLATYKAGNYDVEGIEKILGQSSGMTPKEELQDALDKGKLKPEQEAAVLAMGLVKKDNRGIASQVSGEK
jgi:hypothetical protein